MNKNGNNHLIYQILYSLHSLIIINNKLQLYVG